MKPTSTIARIRPPPVRPATSPHSVVPAAAVYKAPRKWTVLVAFTLAVGIHIAAVVIAGMKCEPAAYVAAQNFGQVSEVASGVSVPQLAEPTLPTRTLGASAD